MGNLKLQNWNVKCLAFSFEGLCICYCKAYAKYPFFKWWSRSQLFHFGSISLHTFYIYLLKTFVNTSHCISCTLKACIQQVKETDDRADIYLQIQLFFFLQSDHIYTSLIITFLIQIEPFDFLHCRHEYECKQLQSLFNSSTVLFNLRLKKDTIAY